MNTVPERIATMYDYYQRGYTLEQVGSKFHYAGMSVSRLFRDYGLPIRTPNQTRRLKAYPQTLRMYRDYQAGMSYDAIGEKYGLVGSSVWRRFKRWGFVRREGYADDCEG